MNVSTPDLEASAKPPAISPENKRRVKNVLMALAIPSLFSFSLLVFVTLFFPYDKLRDYLVASFNAQQRATNGQFELKIETMGPWWPPGVKARGVHLKSLQVDPTKPPIEMEIEEIRGRVSLLPLLWFTQRIGFEIDAFQGHIDGRVDLSSASRRVVVEVDDIELGDATMVGAQIGLPLLGKLKGKVDLTMPEGKASKGNGTVQFDGVDMAVGDGKAPIQTPMGPFTIPKLVIGPLAISAEAKDGKLTVTKLAAQGKDVDVSGDGKITMREMAAESPVDVSLKFKINDSYRAKNEKTKTLFGDPSKPASGLGAGLIDMDPTMKKAKQADGFYVFRLGGKLGRLKPEAVGGR